MWPFSGEFLIIPHDCCRWSFPRWTAGNKLQGFNSVWQRGEVFSRRNQSVFRSRSRSRQTSEPVENERPHLHVSGYETTSQRCLFRADERSIEIIYTHASIDNDPLSVDSGGARAEQKRDCGRDFFRLYGLLTQRGFFGEQIAVHITRNSRGRGSLQQAWANCVESDLRKLRKRLRQKAK